MSDLKRGLSEAVGRVVQGHVVEDVPVGDQQIEVAVVVRVEELRSESERREARPEAGADRRIFKEPLAQI